MRLRIRKSQGNLLRISEHEVYAVGCLVCKVVEVCEEQAGAGGGNGDEVPGVEVYEAGVDHDEAAEVSVALQSHRRC
jgi:hypothetical protein